MPPIHPYLDPVLSPEHRAEDLLSRMLRYSAFADPSLGGAVMSRNGPEKLRA
jgi:hypothetical protein